MDKFIFDFENETFRIEGNDISYEHQLPGLQNSREKILNAAGIKVMEMKEFKEVIEEFREGKLDQDELVEKIIEAAMDAVKSEFPEELN